MEGTGVGLDVVSLAQRPQLAEHLGGLASTWPEFMMQHPTGDLYYERVGDLYADYVLAAVSPTDPDVPLALAYSVPFSWEHPLDALPDGGWSWVVHQACADRLTGHVPTLVSALEIVVRPDLRGRGLSSLMLAALRSNAARLGYPALVAPVRPNAKHSAPRLPMADYIALRQPDGLPQDPWLRVHVRAGGRILGVAPLSMVVAGTLAQWRRWTGLPFDRTGPVIVPEALVPVQCDVDHGSAVYVEPNVWVHHTVE